MVGLLFSLKVKEWAEFEAEEAAINAPSPYAPLYEMQAKAEVAARAVEQQKHLASLREPATKEPGKTNIFPALTQAERAKAQQIIRGMDITRDEVENVTWYEHPGKIGMDVSLYVGVFPSGNPVLRFKMRYQGDDWIFIKQFLVRADSELLTIKPKEELDRQNSDSHVWEIYDEPVGDNIDTILKIINSRKCIIRFEGEKYYYDYRVTDRGAESSMAQVLLVYRYLGGNFEK